MKKILNIILALLIVVTVMLTLWAVATGGSDASINANLYWGYTLLVLGVVAAVGGAVFSMTKSASGNRSSLIAFILIVAVIGISYFISAGHTVNIVDIQNNGFFGHNETVITETSILVTYVAFGASIVLALATAVWNAFK